MNSSPTPYLEDEWRFEEHFRPIETDLENISTSLPIKLARAYVDRSDIGNHRFFKRAAVDKRYILEWAKQESVITNHFSQALFLFLSKVKNVHLRSLLSPVVTGEHGRLAEGVAHGSHPHLLSKLVKDLGIAPEEIRPLDCTKRFASALYGCTDDICFALGFLGCGNEALLIPEYTAVETAFSIYYPREVFRPFLRANIEEDKLHSQLLEFAACAHFDWGHDPEKYVQGAKQGVEARLRYYDELCIAIG